MPQILARQRERESARERGRAVERGAHPAADKLAISLAMLFNSFAVALAFFVRIFFFVSTHKLRKFLLCASRRNGTGSLLLVFLGPGTSNFSACPVHAY